MSYSSRYGSSYSSKDYSSPYSSSRYTSSYSTDRDYGSSSRRISNTKDYLKDYSSTKDYSKDYSSSGYTSKYSSSYEPGKYTSRYSSLSKSMDESKLDDAPTETLATEEPAQEVLQESDVDHFKEDKEELAEEHHHEEEQAAEEEHEEEEAKPEAEPEPEAKPEPVEEVVYERKSFSSYREPEPEPKSPSPTRRISAYSANENHDPKPRSEGGSWPPADSEEKKSDKGPVSKKNVSDLIARFNSGNIVNETTKNDQAYKSAYGATKGSGKINQSVFQ